MNSILVFAKCRLFQNLKGVQHISKAAVAYQFKVEKRIYYPNRQCEMDRINEQQKSQLVEAEKQTVLPKDYYYRILGVRKFATAQQIKAAYYALAKRFHPDASPSLQQSKRFQDISNAYHILSDENKRLEYDQLGAVKDEKSFLDSITTLNKVLTTSKVNNSPLQATRDGKILDINFSIKLRCVQ